MGPITYGGTINKTPTRIFKVVNAIEDCRGKAVKYDASGEGVVLCESADSSFLGIIIYEGLKPVKEGEEVSVQIKDIGLAVAGGEIEVGDYVSPTTDGKFVKADSGFAAGQAMTKATTDQTFYLQITKTGSIS